MTQNRYIALVIGLFLAISILKAQVTIGSSIPPIPGAILDLKQDVNNGANSTKGLLLPRVNIESRTMLELVSGEVWVEDLHIGLMVYNLNKIDNSGDELIAERDEMLCPGVHIWMGEEWKPLSGFPDTGLKCDGTDTRLPAFNACGDVITDNEQNQYLTAKFGAKCWFTQGLRTKEGLTEGVDYVEPAASVVTQDLLYSWDAATGGVVNDAILPTQPTSITSSVQGLCPDGWFVPSDADWNELEKYILENPQTHTTGGAIPQTWDLANNYSFGWRPISPASTSWGDLMLTGSLSKPADQEGFAFDRTGFSFDGQSSRENLVAYSWTSTVTYTPIGSTDETAIYRGASVSQNAIGFPTIQEGAVYKGEASRNSKLTVRCIQSVN